MDSNSNEQTELLRNIWNQMKELDRSLGARIDLVRIELSGAKSEVAELRKDVLGLKQEVVEVKRELIEMRREMIEIKTDVSEIRNDVHDLKLEVKAVRVATQGTFELLGRDHRKLSERVDRIENHLGLRPPKRKH